MKAEFNISKAGNKIFMEVAGSLTAQTSVPFRDHLQKLLLENMPIRISLKDVSAIDVSGIQLIKTFTEECATRNVEITVALFENSEIIHLLAQTGLLEAINN